MMVVVVVVVVVVAVVVAAAVPLCIVLFHISNMGCEGVLMDKTLSFIKCSIMQLLFCCRQRGL